MKYKYIPMQTTLADDKTFRTCWGIALTEINDDTSVIIDEYCDIAQSLEEIAEFVRLCNELELDKSHFAAAVEDFLTK